MDDAKTHELRNRMQEVRTSLCRDMTDVVRSARTLTDWRRYVASWPWAFVAGAAALGYVAAPRLGKTSADEHASHTGNGRDAAATKSQTGVLSNLVRTLSSAALRGALAYAGQKVVQRFQASENGSHMGESSHAEPSRR